jgi:hypothetical protein
MNSSKVVVGRSSFGMQSGVAAFAVGLAAFGFAGVASAQDASASATASAPAMATAGSSAGTDHAKVVEHLGFTWLGVNGIDIAGSVSNTGAITPQTLQAPTIGVRYWLNEGMGLDVGLGLHYSSSSSEFKNGSTTTTTDNPSKLAALVHVGVPIVLGTPGKHYKFTVIPEANVGYGSSTVKFQPQGNQPAAKDLELSGLSLNVGARVGAEIQFGFIGIPELALQGTVGLGFTHSSVKAKQDTIEASSSANTLQTTVQSSPWGLFTNSVAAIYYF